MKKIRITAFLAALTLLSLTACRNTPEDLTISDLREPEDIQPMNLTYTAEQLPVTMDSGQEDVFVFGDYIFWEEGDFSSYYEIFNLSANAPSESPFPKYEGFTLSFQPVHLNVEEENLRVLYSESEFDADGDWLGSRCVQVQLDESLTPSPETVLCEYGTEDSGKIDTPYVRNPDGSYFAVNFDGTAEQLYLLDANMQRIGRVDAPPLYVENMFSVGDNVYVMYQENLGDQSFRLGILSTETMALETPDIADLPNGLTDVFAGNDDYALFVMNRDGMFGIREGTCTQVVDFLKINFNGSRAQHGAALPDGRFLLGIYNADYTETEYWVLTPCEAPETEPDIIRFATLYDGYEDEVNAFNRAHADCRIELVSYSQYVVDGDPDAAVTKYQSDMLAGDVADIVENNGLPFKNYARKGLYEDLYPWMEQDESFEPDEYFMNYFKALETDGRLYQINFGFGVETFAAKTEFVGDVQPPLTFPEFWQLTQNLPEGMDIFWDMDEYSLLNTLCTPNLHCFADTETATCNFNTPEFVSLLEQCKDYIDNEEQDEAFAWEYAYRNNDVLLMNVRLEEPYDWHYAIAGDFGGAQVTMLGIPSNDKTSSGGRFLSYNGLAMSSLSEHKEQVWEFFRTLLSENHQNKLEYGLPVLRSAMEQRMDAAMKPTIPEGSTEIDVNRSWFADAIYPIGNATQEEMDAFLAYVEGITEINDTDPQIYTIFWEEVEMYLAGDQNAQKAAEMIQSRASIYLSEQS